MDRLPNRAPNLSRLFRTLAHIGVRRVDVRFDDRGAVDTAAVVLGSLQTTVSARDLPGIFDGAKVLLVDDRGRTLDVTVAEAVVAAAHGDDVAGSTVTLDIRRHEIARATPVTFVDPGAFLASAR